MTSSKALADPKGTAALGICESLLLALIDLKVMSAKDVTDLLSDVAETHIQAAKLTDTPHHHIAVADVIKAMLVGKV